MNTTARLLACCALSLLAACSPKNEAKDEKAPASGLAAAIIPAATPVPAGSYKLDKSHASLIFRVNHLGFSNYTARFKRFDADLELDPARPEAAMLSATIETRSLETDFPDPATLDFNAELTGPQWLNAAQFPAITYRSTAITLTSPNSARITGDLTLHGVTRPVVLEARFNGGYVGHPMDPHARIGFSAHGTLNRSEFGVAYGIPAPGTTMGVSDAVDIILEAEFSGPAMPPGTETAPSAP